MAQADRHTRLVGWLKLTLPLVALAILSTLFLLADRIDPDAALPYAEVDVEDLAREPRMTAPSFAGITADGAALTLTADEARMETDTRPGQVLGLRLHLATPDGATTEVTARTATLDRARREIVLSGGVVATTSTGYRVAIAELVARTDRSSLQSRGPVTAEGPAGRIEAGGMRLSQDLRTPGSYVLVFKQGVRLIYRPGG